MMFRLHLSLLVAGQALFGCQGQRSNAGEINIRSELSKFSSFLDNYGVSPGIGKTILAPNNLAFENFSQENPDVEGFYRSDKYFLHYRTIMLWHLIIEGVFSYDMIFDGSRALLGNTDGNITIDQLEMTMDGVSNSSIVDPNIETSNGIIHIMDRVILPPFFILGISDQLISDRNKKFDFTTFASLALFAGLNEEIDAILDGGITVLVPPNRRFIRAEIDVATMLTDEMKNYTKAFVHCHMIKDNYYESGVFTAFEQQGISQLLVTTYLGTHLWITTTGNLLRFQSTELLLPDQVARNGYVLSFHFQSSFVVHV
jgi:uncharacterized surface protein with fasciclin (FAS1) repeats